MVISKLPKFGDENWMWTGFTASGTTSVDFRQGNIYIHVIAPTQVTAKRFARLVMERLTVPATELDAANK
jgi:hypothetical protein